MYMYTKMGSKRKSEYNIVLLGALGVGKSGNVLLKFLILVHVYQTHKTMNLGNYLSFHADTFLIY